MGWMKVDERDIGQDKQEVVLIKVPADSERLYESGPWYTDLQLNLGDRDTAASIKRSRNHLDWVVAGPQENQVHLLVAYKQQETMRARKRQQTYWSNWELAPDLAETDPKIKYWYGVKVRTLV